MTLRINIGLILAAVCVSPRASHAAPPGPPAPIVYFDIAGPDAAGQTSFYEKIFGWTAGPGGVVSVPVQGPKLGGSLRTDPAAKVIYIGVPDVSATLRTIAADGGKIVAPRFEVKGTVVLGLFADPAGNVMGLVELTPDGRVKIP